MLGQHVNRVPNPAEDLAPRLQAKGYRCTLSSPLANRYLRIIDILRTLVRTNREIDVVSLQTYSGLSFIVEDIVSWVVKRLQIPLVMVMHGGKLPELASSHPIWVKRVLNRANVLVTPSHYIQHALAPSGFPIQVIANGLEIENYSFRLRNNVAPRLVWLRALHQVYEPEMAVNALALLRVNFPDTTLLMVGPDKKDGSRERIEQIVAKCGVQNGMRWIGAVTKRDVPNYLNQGDIFLNTTRYESFGISVIEAAACGLPIVTTNAGELSYMWENDQDALLVNRSDAKGMAESVQRLLIEPGLAKKLSYNGRQKAERFDWSVILSEWDKLFRKVIIR